MWRFGVTIGLSLYMSLSYADPMDDVVISIQNPTSQNAAKDSKKNVALRKEEAGDVIMHAMGLLGVAYHFGGSSPNQGLDCSGFIQYVFKNSMRVNLPRTAAQMAKTGHGVEREHLKAGDLVFFNTRGFPNSHVGLFIGNDKFMHAPRAGKNVEVVSLSSKYWSARFNGARRVDSSSKAAAFVTKTSDTSIISTPSLKVESRNPPAITKQAAKPVEKVASKNAKEGTKKSSSKTKQETAKSSSKKNSADNKTSSKKGNTKVKSATSVNTKSKAKPATDTKVKPKKK